MKLLFKQNDDMFSYIFEAHVLGEHSVLERINGKAEKLAKENGLEYDSSFDSDEELWIFSYKSLDFFGNWNIGIEKIISPIFEEGATPYMIWGVDDDNGQFYTNDAEGKYYKRYFVGTENGLVYFEDQQKALNLAKEIAKSKLDNSELDSIDFECYTKFSINLVGYNRIPIKLVSSASEETPNENPYRVDDKQLSLLKEHQITTTEKDLQERIYLLKNLIGSLESELKQSQERIKGFALSNIVSTMKILGLNQILFKYLKPNGVFESWYTISNDRRFPEEIGPINPDIHIEEINDESFSFYDKDDYANVSISRIRLTENDTFEYMAFDGASSEESGWTPLSAEHLKILDDVIRQIRETLDDGSPSNFLIRYSKMYQNIPENYSGVLKEYY